LARGSNANECVAFASAGLQCFFSFVNFVIGSQSGDDPHKDLAKSGYKLNIEIVFYKKPFYIFLLPTSTMSRNLVIFLLF
jgi:hypothetical protein